VERTVTYELELDGHVLTPGTFFRVQGMRAPKTMRYISTVTQGDSCWVECFEGKYVKGTWLSYKARSIMPDRIRLDTIGKP
jgi:hypothetical protein